MVERLFLAVPQAFLRFVIVVFPDHTHLLLFFVILSLFLEFLIFYELYHGLSFSRTTIVLFGMHNLANSIKAFAYNELASLTVP